MPEISNIQIFKIRDLLKLQKLNNFWAKYGTKFCISSGIIKSAITINMVLYPNKKQCIIFRVFHVDTTYQYSLEYL